MTDYTLTVLDTPGIQSYIFGSNRLRENIGGSELVRRATEQWPLEILKGMGDSNVNKPTALKPAQRLNDELCIEDGKLDAEVIYVGGGNIVILFREDTHARAFVTQLNYKTLEEAPGLDLIAAHVPFDWAQDRLRDKVDEANRQLARRKQSRPASQPLLGLGVTAACQSTGLVATTTNTVHGKPNGEDAYAISDAVAAKLEMVEAAQNRLQDIFADDIRRTNYDFPRAFDEFGRSKGEMSYIAVVHADGNQMGQFFRSIGVGTKDPRAYIRELRGASTRVEDAGMEALNQTIRTLIASVDYDDENDPMVGGKVPVRDGKLPIRPLVFGGDDVTFVCDGRLGLTLAARYLEAFQEKCEERHLDLHACAGIAVVKTHYPFARAYELSEKLAGNAKAYVREEIGQDASALDWHFAVSGLMGGVDEIRRREYAVDAGSLYLRPLPLAEDGWRSWPKFIQVLETFEEDWYERRNKMIALREVLRQGPDATKTYIQSIGETLPELDPGIPDLKENGWIGDQCAYFDAIEAADFYVPLRGV